jgi:hypothetical protein
MAAKEKLGRESCPTHAPKQSATKANQPQLSRLGSTRDRQGLLKDGRSTVGRNVVKSACQNGCTQISCIWVVPDGTTLLKRSPVWGLITVVNGVGAATKGKRTRGN